VTRDSHGEKPSQAAVAFRETQALFGNDARRVRADDRRALCPVPDSRELGHVAIESQKFVNSGQTVRGTIFNTDAVLWQLPVSL
jgi:hypothetical protein